MNILRPSLTWTVCSLILEWIISQVLNHQSNESTFFCEDSEAEASSHQVRFSSANGYVVIASVQPMDQHQENKSHQREKDDTNST